MVVIGEIMTTTITNEKSINKKERLSGIEAYRILAILLICISHAVQTGMNYISYSNSKVITVLINILSYSGQCGNIMFIICSSYFLVDSKKLKLDKVLKILLDSTLISIFVIFCMSLAGYTFTLTTIIMQFFPDYFSNMWFIPIYVLFYLIHPLLNLIINNISQKGHFFLCLSIFLVYGIGGLFTGWSLGVNDLITFIIIYFFVSYIKRYWNNFMGNTKMNTGLFLLFVALFIILAILKIIIPLKWLTINQRYSPVLFPMLLFLFNIFKNLKIKSKSINYLASCSLFVYCFHENILLRSIIRPKFYEYVLSINPNFYFGWVLICGIGMFILGYLISLLYKTTISKLTNYVSPKISNIILKILDFAYIKSFSKEKTKFEKNKEILDSTPIILDSNNNLNSLSDKKQTSITDETNK